MDRRGNVLQAGGVIIEGIDVLEVVGFLNSKNKKYLAMLLNDIEDILPKHSDEYQKIRKEVLDKFNQYTRSVVEVLFGEQLEK